MRARLCVRTIAVVATAAAIGPAAAQAKFDDAVNPSEGGIALAPIQAPAAQHPGDSTEWLLIGLGAAGGTALVGAGATASRRRSRRRLAPSNVGTASGS